MTGVYMKAQDDIHKQCKLTRKDMVGNPLVDKFTLEEFVLSLCMCLFLEVNLCDAGAS